MERGARVDVNTCIDGLSLLEYAGLWPHPSQEEASTARTAIRVWDSVFDGAG